MKKYIILFLLLSGCTTIERVSEVTVNKGFPHNEIRKIAVIMFETVVNGEEKTGRVSKSVTLPDAGVILAGMTARELVESGQYVVVDRKALEEELKLKNFREEDLLQMENYLSIGTLLGIDAVVIGKVKRFEITYKTLSHGMISALTAIVSFTTRCVDVTTNETIWSINIKGSSKEDNERVLASKLITKAVKALKTELGH